MGQYSSAPQARPAVLEWVTVLYLFADDLDEAYLDRRIQEDTAGDFDLSALTRQQRMSYRTVTIEEQAERIARRVEALGWSSVPASVNDGARRTPEKRRLLTAIEENAQAQGREPRFKAQFVPLVDK